MRPHHVHVEHTFTQPVERVFAFLAEHENLGAIFAPLRVERIADGQTERNGVGSCPPPEPVRPPAIRGDRRSSRPERAHRLQHHQGRPDEGPRGRHGVLHPPNGGSHLDYRIRFASAIPGLAAIMKRAVTRSIVQGLKKVDKAA